MGCLKFNITVQTFLESLAVDTPEEGEKFIQYFIHAPIKDVEKCIIYLCENGYVHLLSRTTERRGISLNYRNGVPFVKACWASQNSIIRYLLQSRQVNPLCQGGSGVKACIILNNQEGLEDILKFSQRVSTYKDSYFLQLASSLNRVECVKLLLKSGADTTCERGKCLILASKYGYHEVVKILLCDQRTNPGLMNNKPLLSACRNKHSEVVKLLLSHELTNPTVMKFSALVLSLENRDKQSVKYLLNWYMRYGLNQLSGVIDSFSIKHIEILSEILHPKLGMKNRYSENIKVFVTQNRYIRVDKKILERSEFFISAIEFKELQGIPVEIEMYRYDLTEETIKVILKFLATGKVSKRLSRNTLIKLKNQGDFLLIKHNLLDTLVEKILIS